MGWGAPTGGTVRTQAAGQFWDGQLIANLKGFNVLLVPVEELPDTSVQREVDKAFFKQFAERITIFQSSTMTSWLWPRKRASGFLAAEKYEYASGSMPDYLAQKLAAISFTVADHTRGITLGQVRDKVRGQFDTSAVTKKFYEDFKKQHESLTSQIQGLPESEAHSYSSILLNRLMFIYFLQKKEFINNDPNYLRTCLNKLQELNSDLKFYSFYKDLLRTLFFDGLNRQPHDFSDPKIAEILGDPPYINGGIFGASDIEENFVIDIPDKAFEDIFNLFDSYRWHLDTSPTGNANEINPEVIGYIFEQYINYTANGRKDNGAYYTPQDVCGYMAKNSLVPLLLGKLVALDATCLNLALEDPLGYINQDLLHGLISETNELVVFDKDMEALWESDPLGWPSLDSMHSIDEINLPGETWVESFHRRDRVKSLIQRLSTGEIGSVPDDFVTYPLDGLLLISNYLRHEATEETLFAFWNELVGISVIDPTCGSGAFLFAALEILEDIYFAVLDGQASLNLEVPESYGDYFGFDGAVARSRKYAVRKIIAVNNLYGTDLMPDAIETAKLRLFLSLVACLDEPRQLEPLPDLDFNFKVANLVLGFYNAEDSFRVRDDLWIKSSLQDLDSEIEDFKNLHERFLKVSRSKSSSGIHSLKSELTTKSKSLRNQCNLLYADAIGLEPSAISSWVETHRPFHWFIEFPEVVESGGFDLVIGNPPYIKRSDIPDETSKYLVGYETYSCPDFYAVCYERSLQLLKSTGRHAFIVMMNLAFSDKFEPLRKVIDKKFGGSWWSTFGKRPDSLFRGVEVVNSILLLGGDGPKFASSHNLFSAERRKWMFQSMSYAHSNREPGAKPIRSGVASVLADLISKSQRSSCDMGADSIYCSTTARYWYSVLPDEVPVLDQNGMAISELESPLKRLRILSCEPKNVALSLLGGKLGYLWWVSTGDDFHSDPSFGSQVLGVLSLLSIDDELEGIANRVAQAAKASAFVSKNAKKQYINFRWSSIRGSSDLFDSLIVKSISGDQAWRDLNVWYRQTMISSGSNANSEPLDPSKYDSLVSAHQNK
jgi:type I restriction-modification system DNA methylase subunit